VVKSILSSPQETVLEHALSASALRHKVISNNIANVNTPGFKRSDVAFEDQLEQALTPTMGDLTRTHARHIAGRRPGSGGFSPQVTTDTTTTVRTDGSNVDIDAEMAGMAKNTIYYDAVAQQLGRYFSQIKSVINEGRR
jgi:flagellar basal-body rod protein FlgB